MSAEVLSGPERAVFEFLAKGRSDSRMLADMGLSQAAFNDVLQQLFGKLGVSSRIELILFAHCEPARFIRGETGIGVESLVQCDGTAQKATLSDAAAGNVKAAGEWAA